MATKENSVNTEQVSAAEESEQGSLSRESDDGAPSPSKKLKSEDLSDREWVQHPCRRVIAILPGVGKGTLNNDIESSDNELSDTRSEGVLETSTDSSDDDSGIPFPTKTKVIIKKSEQQSAQ
ncbi:uncharacterized protein [Watersipora subatra]|uniref:uncharacterized protein n=1 Tax=Watersipora subatra TaxID=2589382 RepID=UPI00355BE08D